MQWFSLHVVYALDVLMHREEHALAVAHHLSCIKGVAPRANPHGVIFFACDPVFMERFGDALILSCYENARECGVHVHLYEPTAEILRHLEVLKARLSDLKLSYTYEENIDFGRLPDRGMYYTAFRFVTLGKIIQESHSPVICLDADSVIVRTLQHVIADARRYDVGLYFRLRRRRLNKKIAAFCVVLNDTPAALEFIAFFSGLAMKFHQRYRGYRSNFFFDQSGLYFSYLVGKLTAKWSFHAIGKAVVDYDFGETACIWTAKGKRKDDAAFVSESRRVIGRHVAVLAERDEPV